jgi:RNA polymerase sigma-70 factor (ECF subfamily)
MCLHLARLPARVDAAGNLKSLSDQDRSQWDPALIAEGERLLDLSARGAHVTEYHVEAAIASLHARASRTEETDWGAIVTLYDTLLKVHPSPVVALNRAIAVAQRDGPERGLLEIEAIPDRERLSRYPFYEAALGELALGAGKRERARGHFKAAIALARNPMERRFLEERLGVALSEDP